MLIAVGTVPEPPFASNVMVAGARAGILIEALQLEVVDSPPPFKTVLIVLVCAVDALLNVYVTDLIALVSTPTRDAEDIDPDTVVCPVPLIVQVKLLPDL